VKETQNGLQKTNTWSKKFGKRRQEWEQAYSKNEMPHQKLKTLVKTRFANKVIMFEETFQFKNAIIICYGKQNYIFFQQKILKAQVWAIVEVIASTLHLVVLSHCGMNRSRGH